MNKSRVGSSTALAMLVASAATGAMAPEPVDERVVAQLRYEGFENSMVMEWAAVMTDVYGPRYANSPGYDAAADWARDTFESFGLDNVALEPWGEYGYGWENDYTSVHLMSPRYQSIIAYPVPGSESTRGKVTAAVTVIDTQRIFTEDDLEFFNVAFHTNMDVYDRLVAADLKQAAVILASFAYHAAMRDGPFPYADGINNGRRWHK